MSETKCHWPECPHGANCVHAGGVGLSEVLAAHRGWAETGPNDDGSWNLVCHTCGANLCVMRGGYVSEAERDQHQAAHVATAVLAWVAERLDGAREDVAEAINHPHWCESNYTTGCTCTDWREGEANTALTAVRGALGITRPAEQQPRTTHDEHTRSS